MTAVALAGTPPRPATWNILALWQMNGPDKPLPLRVSRMRDGVSGTKVDPLMSGVK